MNGMPLDLIEKYKNPILKFLCERQNRKIKNKSKDIVFGIRVEMAEPILNEINEGPFKGVPISKEVFDYILNSFLKSALIIAYKRKKDSYIISKKAYEVAKINMLEVPKPVRKEAMEIHENIECGKCLITDGYGPRDRKCRWCGTALHRK